MALAGCAFLIVVSSAANAATAAQSEVGVSTDRDSYCHGDPVAVTIRNNLSSPIHVTSGQSFCTIVTIEEKRDEAWKAAGACPAGAPPGVVTIAGGATLVISLDAGNIFYSPLAIGTYRATFNYARNADGTGDGLSFSPEFQIEDCGAN